MTRIPIALPLALAILPLAAPAQECGARPPAQMAHICDDWQSQLWNLAEPWEQNTRTFANGAVRVAVVDTVEPAAAALFLAVLVPLPDDPLGGRRCMLVGSDALRGFAGLDFAAMAAEYDPARGIVLDLPVRLMNEVGGFDDCHAEIVIDQRIGDVEARLK